MHTHQFPLRDSIDAGTLRTCGSHLLDRLGPMLTCAWPDMASWLDELVPELANEQPEPPFAEYRLSPQETRRLLTPEFDTLYPVNDEVLLARLLLAAIRHSELSLVLLPQHVSRGHVVGLLRLAGESRFEAPAPDRPLRSKWLVDVGSYDVDDKVARVFTDRLEFLEELAALLAPLGMAGASQQENRSR